MFDPAGYLHLARSLVDEAEAGPAQTRAARMRAAYSRLYYGLYLRVRAAITLRHRISVRRLRHGDLFARLQFESSPARLRRVGRELQRLYSLRQQADYELAPERRWEEQLDDPALARYLAGRALELAAAVDDLDFSPVVHLF